MLPGNMAGTWSSLRALCFTRDLCRTHRNLSRWELLLRSNLDGHGPKQIQRVCQITALAEHGFPVIWESLSWKQYYLKSVAGTPAVHWHQ